MKDENKTKKQLLNDLEGLRQHIAELELVVNERKRAEGEIKTLEQQMEYILGVTRTGLDIIDSKFNVRYIDPEWAKVYGDPAGKKCHEYFMGRKEVCSSCGIPEALKTKKPVITEEVLVKENNKPVQVTTIPFQNEVGEWLFAEVNVDITERKRVEEVLRESEEKYHRVVEHANQGIGINQDGMGKFPNPKMLEIFGYSQEELCGKPLLELIHPDDREKAAETYLRRLQGKEVPQVYDFRIVDKDGNIRWVEINATLITWEGRPASLTFLNDITNRKQMEEALKESEEKYHRVVEYANQGIFIAQDDVIKFPNPKMLEISGYSNEELCFKPFRQFIHPDDREMVAERHTKIVKGEEVPHICDFRVVDKDGNIKWVEVNSTLIIWEGRPAALTFSSDITERKRVEEALRESEEKYHRVVEYANQGIFIAQDDVIKFPNPRLLEISGYSKEELCSRPFRQFIHPDDREMVVERYMNRLKGEEVLHTYNFRIVRKDGNIRWAEINVTLITWEGRLASLNFLSDITERKRVEEALRESEEKYHRVVECANQGIVITQDGKPKFPNPKILEIFGHSQEELCGKPFLQFIHPDDREMVSENYLRRVGGNEVAPVYDIRIADKDGNIKWVETCSNLIIWEGGPATLTFLTDISRRKKAEEKVRIYQAQLRSLASEISLMEARERRQIAIDLHDNIGQNLAIAQIKLGELREKASSTNLADYVDEIRKQVDESIQFTRTLTSELSPPVLYELGFEAAVEWLTEQVQEQHKIQVDFKAEKQSKPMSEEVRIFLFKGIKELLTNIVKHARAKNAKVSIRSDNNNVRVLVEDDGVGFYFNKDKQFGKRDGFGLFSISERLKHLGGDFEIESKPGQGTRITLAVPLEKKENSEGRST